MRNGIAILMALTLMACSGQDQSNSQEGSTGAAQKHIGLVHGPLPAGVVRRGWVFLDSVNGKDYALTAIAEGQQRMLWLDQGVRADTAMLWKVIDVLAFDSLESKEALQVGTCTSADVPALEVVALTERPAPTAAATVKRAWRANRTAQKFSPLRPGAVVCK